MKKHAKVIRVSSDFIEVMYQDSTTEKFKYGIFPQDLRPKDSFVEIDESIEEGEYHVTIKEGAPFELLCTCTQECDCQNPPPADWDGKNGSWGISNHCPIHNEHPEPNPNCPVHG
jgi:hypothetical protein